MWRKLIISSGGRWKCWSSACIYQSSSIFMVHCLLRSSRDVLQCTSSMISLSEIGADLQVSRQAVYDILHRSEQTMMEYEEKLGLAKRIQDERQVLDKVYDEISKLADTADAGRVKDILGQLAPYVSAAQEE